ncbi:MAG TPA: tetratricopeptide repeat protein [Pirellulaceae bacterium]|nr:tetratricopeptide repeat protein [Pirellulaceae bacterium]
MSDRSAIRGFPQRHPRLAIAGLLLGLAIAVGIGIVVRRETQARRDWQQAQAAAVQYDFDRARDHLRAYLRWRYFHGSAHFACARACRRATSEDYIQAREHLQAAEMLGHAADEIKLERALIQVQESGEIGPEESFLKLRLTAASPDQSLILEAIARGCIRAGLVNKANEWLDKWVQFAPDDWYARMWRGCLFQHTARPQLAIEDFSMVLRYRPDDLPVRKQLGLALAASGYDYPAAITHLEHCQQHGPADSEVLTALADCCRAVGRHDEARTLLSTVLDEQPADYDAQLALALLELDLGNDAAALKTLEQLEKEDLKLDAVEALHRMLHLDPVPNPPHVTERREKVLHLRAVALRRLARRDEADRCAAELERIRQLASELKSALKEQKQRPRDAELIVQVGKIYLDLALPAEGMSWLEKVLAENAEHPGAHAVLANYYQSLGTAVAREKALFHRQFTRGN